ncbi:MAG: hypothetical protein R2800_06440 [Flavipsychrobacter sp.]
MLFVQSSVTAQEIAKHRKVSILPVPAFGYAPETSTYLGAVSLFTFDFYKDSLTRVSNAKLEFNYTWNKQIIIDADWNYFFKEEKWFTKGRLHYSKFPDKYYGIGNDTKEVDEVLYTSNRYIADISVYKKVDREWFVGLGGKYMLFDKLQKERVLYPKLSSNNSTGLGFSLFKDVRNSLLSPKKGSYYYLYTTYVFQQKYLKLNLDVRKYYTIKEMLTFSLRTYNEFTFSQPPFYDFAFLGGDKQVRGYYYGRFRDNNLSTIQFEARSIFLWRLGLAAFGGGANLYSNVSSFRLGDTKYNYGLGLRFLIDRKQDINLRIDYAIGEGDNSGFYVSFGEAF